MKTVDKSRYDTVTIAFHWTSAALVLALFGSAMAWSYAPRDWGLRWLSSVHISLGIALAAVVVGRLIWRAAFGKRLEHSDSRSMDSVLANLMHLALYGLLILQIVLGFGIEWIGGLSLSFFGLVEIPTPFAANRDLSEQMEQVHGLVAWTMMALVGGHASAALWHHYALQDNVLRRMLPSSKTR